MCRAGLPRPPVRHRSAGPSPPCGPGIRRSAPAPDRSRRPPDRGAAPRALPPRQPGQCPRPSCRPRGPPTVVDLVHRPPELAAPASPRTRQRPPRDRRRGRRASWSAASTARLSARLASSAALTSRLVRPIAPRRAGCEPHGERSRHARPGRRPARPRRRGRHRAPRSALSSRSPSSTSSARCRPSARTSVRVRPESGTRRDPVEGWTKRALGGRHHEVGGEGEADAGASGDPVDRRHHRLRHAADRLDEGVVLVGEHATEFPLPRPAAEVGAGAEAAARTGDHDGANLGVTSRGLDGGQQLAAHHRVQRVQRLRAVERDGDNAGIGFGEQGLVRRVGHRAIVPAR